MAYVHPESQQLAHAAIDQWSEALRTAQSKVAVAMAPEAFGHGVPGLHNLTTNDILLVFGVGEIDCAMTYAIINLLMQHSEKTKSSQLITVPLCISLLLKGNQAISIFFVF